MGRGQGLAVDSAADRPPLLPGRFGRPGSAVAGARRGVFRTLLWPPLLVLLGCLVVPLLLVAVLSLRPSLAGPLLAGFEPTLAHYAASLGFLRLLLTSIVIAAIVAAAATALAYPIAWFLRFVAGRHAALLLLLLLIPFWTSYLLRVMAWKLMLGSEGVINSLLISSGLIDQPLAALLYNRGAVVVTLVYVWIPFAALPILAALQRVDSALHEAAGDLYARPFSQFWRVTLPLSMPGVLVAFFMVFIPTVGEYVTPLLVGGTGGAMYGNIIHDFFTRAANWPLGAAMAVVMLGATLAFALVALRLIDLRRLVAR